MRRYAAAAATLLLASTLMVPVGAQDSIEDARARQDEVQRESAETAGQIDELNAEDAEIVEALAQIDAWVSAQESRLERAQQQLQTTREVEAEAFARAAELADQITDLQDLVREQVVESYIGGFRNDDELILGSDDINEVPLLRFALDESTGSAVDATDLLRLAMDQQADAITEAERATEAAEAIEADIEGRIAELEKSRADQERVRAEVTARIEALEDVASTLAAEDQAITDFILAEQERIRLAEEERRRAEEAERLRVAEAERQAEEERLRLEEEQRLAEEAENAPDPEPTPEPGDPDPDPTPEPEPEPDPGAPRFTAPVPHGISSGFGYRIHPIYGTSRLHTGIDYNSPNGAAIGAAANGTVIFAGARSGYGNTVIVQHSGGYTTLYAHMSGFNVSSGATVTAGTTVGFVGSTGLSTGPHLHFEIRINGVAIDPMPLL